MKKIKIVVVGYGNRGSVYADYSLKNPEELQVAAVVDPDDFKLSVAKKKYQMEDRCLFHSFAEFEKSGISCDIIVNATMDQKHYETAMEILAAGYHMLMEKPVVSNAEELKDIANLAREKNLQVFVCHVLRYTPFYRKVKELIEDGVLGEIMTMELSEHVCIPHYLASYVRGKWNSEKECRSGFLLAKSCHDLDVMCWLNNAATPKRIASFGHRSQFIPQKAPDGATQYCYQCPHVDTCTYSAKEQYLSQNVMPFLVWDRLSKPLDEITVEEKEEFLKSDVYGQCAYTCGGDIVDRQSVIVTFSNGSTATFNLVGGSTKAGRFLHIAGSKGEIEGMLESDTFTLLLNAKGKLCGEGRQIEVKPVNDVEFGGHSGGDFAIMHDLIRYLNGDRSSVSITHLEDSLNGHFCVYAAEKSRRENVIVDIGKEFKDE